MRLSQPVTELVGQDWVPAAIKQWWYSEPPAVNDLRVGVWLTLISGLVLIRAVKMLF